MLSGYLRTLGVFIFIFSAFGSCRLDTADSLSNSLLPPRGWRLGNRALFARTIESCGTVVDDPDTPDCRTLCSDSGPCGAGQQPSKKRDLLLARIQAENSTNVLPRDEASKLAKRVFNVVAQAQLPAYVQNTVDTAIPIIPPVQPNVIQANVAVQRVFGAAEIAIGTPGLCGCTVVTVVSTQAIYMGHFFENPSWSNTAAFRNKVLKFFGFGGVPDGTGPVINAALFPIQPSTRVYIMTPRKGAGNPNRSNYRTKVPQLRAQIEAVLGAGVTFVTFNYVPRDCNDNNLFAGQRGVALFQYDPDSDGNNNPGWRLFYEHHVFRNTDGQANPTQPAYNAAAAIGIPD